MLKIFLNIKYLKIFLNFKIFEFNLVFLQSLYSTLCTKNITLKRSVEASPRDAQG